MIQNRISCNINPALGQELHKLVFKQIRRRRKKHSRFEDNISAVDLADTGSLSFKNCGAKYLLCDIDVFPKYAWVKPMTDIRSKTVLNGLSKIAN